METNLFSFNFPTAVATGFTTVKFLPAIYLLKVHKPFGNTFRNPVCFPGAEISEKVNRELGWAQHLHGNQTGHCGAKAIKEVACGEGHKVVHEGSNSEDERELLILSTAVCKQKENLDTVPNSIWLLCISSQVNTRLNKSSSVTLVFPRPLIQFLSSNP